MAIPSKIKCTVCYITKGPNDFSGGQLEKLRQDLRKKTFDTVARTCIKCYICAETRQYSKECNMCDKKKPIEAFTKVQRVLDDGECRRWVDERVNPEPYIAEVDGEATVKKDDDDEGGSGDEAGGGTRSNRGHSVV